MYDSGLLCRIALIEFPEDCDSFVPPHSLNCHKRIWLDSGCTEQGQTFPVSYDKVDSAELNDLNLEYVDCERALHCRI